MSSVNLPASLYDMFQNINDRINRLELGYNGPQASADAAQGLAASAQVIALSSQSTATTAQVQAINAGIQAVIAQSQATIASTQATYAVTTANGKNTVAYGTSAPPSGTHTTGDLYFQFNGSNQVIAQYTWNGSSWVSNPITSTVIASINAGTITSGTITGIEYNNGTGTFHVTPAGALTASSANITGTINAQTGYFGGYGTTGNYWSIGSNGITGVGTATITAGLIQGSSIAIPSASGYNFAVDSSGNMTATAGTIGGFSIQAGYLTYGGQTWLNASSGTGSGSYCLYDTSRGIYLGGTMKASAIDLGSYGWTSSGTITAGTVNSTNVVTAQITGNSNVNISGTTTVTGNLQVTAMSPYNSSTDYAVWWRSSNGRFYYNSSSRRYKENIEIDNTDYLSALVKLNPVSFTYKAEVSDTPDVKQFGLIAEDVDLIPELKPMVTYNKDNQPDAIAYDKLGVFTISALKEINDRLTKLEGK
jgi:hypothetical protein